jgi:hypothetical protein
MKLPNPDQAVVDIRKLRDYCLNPSHPRGRHKARVFLSLLNLSDNDAPALRDFLLQAARLYDVSPSLSDPYGARCTLDAPWPGTTAIIRSTWIVLVAEDFPRLTSCYVL